VSGLSDAQLDTPYREGGWTVRQVVHHVPDSHANCYIRFKLALTEDWPTIKPYDEAAWARLADSGLPVDVSLTLIEALHGALGCAAGIDERKRISRRACPSGAGAGKSWPTTLALYDWHSRHHTAHITGSARTAGLVGLHGWPAKTLASRRSWLKSIEEYLADHPAAAVLEDGRVSVRYAHGALRGERAAWALPAAVVERRAQPDAHGGGVQERAQCLRLTTRRMGAAKPQALELVPTSDRRTPTAREAARRNYQRLLERALTRQFYRIEGGRAAVGDGPGAQLWPGVCARAAAARDGCGCGDWGGRGGVGGVADGVLTLGILWLDHCRQKGDGRRHFGGLKVVVPEGRGGRRRSGWRG
jgi:hypothetical protein